MEGWTEAISNTDQWTDRWDCSRPPGLHPCRVRGSPRDRLGSISCQEPTVLRAKKEPHFLCGVRSGSDGGSSASFKAIHTVTPELSTADTNHAGRTTPTYGFLSDPTDNRCFRRRRSIAGFSNGTTVRRSSQQTGCRFPSRCAFGMYSTKKKGTKTIGLARCGMSPTTTTTTTTKY